MGMTTFTYIALWDEMHALGMHPICSFEGVVGGCSSNGVGLMYVIYGHNSSNSHTITTISPQMPPNLIPKGNEEPVESLKCVGTYI